MATKKLRVGFDFDGVIAYNPLRIFRAPVMTIKHWFNRRPNLEFPLPKNRHFRWFWAFAHETSFFPAPGFTALKHLIEEGKIEAYIITGRYSFLEASLHNWLKKYGADKLFHEIYLNKSDLQPHHFKERILKTLNLDMYVEDNWDIVEYLNSKFQTTNSKQIPNPKSINQNTKKLEIHWIYNIVDRFKPYKNKHPYLKKFIDQIR